MSHLFADNVELVLQPSAIPESGTASVRARPTVKHLNVSLPVSALLLIPELFTSFAYLNNTGFACGEIPSFCRADVDFFFLIVVFILNSGAHTCRTADKRPFIYAGIEVS